MFIVNYDYYSINNNSEGSSNLPRRDYKLIKIVELGSKYKMNTEKLKELDQISLSIPCKSVLLGGFLGHGSLRIDSGYKNARFVFKHSSINKEYFYWKLLFLEEIAARTNKAVEKPTWGPHSKLRFQSKACKDLTIMHKVICRNNNIVVKRKWLNHMTSLSLAIWWMDRGSLIRNKTQGVICTQKMTYADALIVQQYLAAVWRINVTVTTDKRDRPRIYFNKSSLFTLFETIREFVPPFMEHKLDLRWVPKEQ